MSEDKRPAAAAANPLGDGNLTDSQVADLLVSRFPPELRALIGAGMREIVQVAIRRERARAAAVIHQVAAVQAHKARGLAPNEAEEAIYMARCFAGLATMVSTPPGACGRCGGSRKVPSGLSGPEGQPLMSDCPTCAGTPESPIASVVEISSAKPSDPG